MVKPSSSSKMSQRSPKPGKRTVAKLVRTASEDDGAAVYPSPAHSSAFLLQTENDPSWRQYSRVSFHGYLAPAAAVFFLFININNNVVSYF